jgi:proteasome lid subunit RPN8/RPN11
MVDFLEQDCTLKFKEYSKQHTTKESCALAIIFKGRLILKECNNISTNPHNFIIDPIDYIRASSLGEVAAVYHSHLGTDAKPTQSDIRGCNNGKIPWVIYAIESNNIEVILPEQYSIPLIGREYNFGTLDCWSLVQDIYIQELGIKLPRPLEVNPNWFLDTDYFNNMYREYGFTKVLDNTLKKYDIILMQDDSSKVPNHCAIKYDQNTILHHVRGRLSSKDVLGGYWLQRCVGVYRYENNLPIR